MSNNSNFVLNRKFMLFDLVLILRQKKTLNLELFYLFGVLLFWAVRKENKSTTITHYLFNIIPIFKLKREIGQQ